MNRGRERRQQGVMLLEVLIGMLIFSIGILAMLGMQAVGMRATVDAKYRSEASFLANQIIGIMWGDAANLANYVLAADGSGACASNATCTAWRDNVLGKLPADATNDNMPTIAVSGNSVTVTVRWKRKGETSGSQHQVLAQILRATD
jgi:type IV pilus assembly protein PilV